MAKQKPSLFRVKGKLGNATFVSSRAYGDHVRENRGTHKEATINEVLATHAGRTNVINYVGSLFYGTFNKKLARFRDSQCWFRILSALRNSGHNDPAGMLLGLTHLEMNLAHPYQALFSSPFEFDVSLSGSDLTIFYNPGPDHPAFAKPVTHYRYDIMAIYPQLAAPVLIPPKKPGVKTPAPEALYEMCDTGWISLSDDPSPYHFSFTLPDESTHYLLCLYLECKEGNYVIPSGWAQRSFIAAVGSR